MGRPIVELAPGRYVQWSTVVDAPVSWIMTEAELEDYIREEYGRAGLLDLPERMARLRETGTSAIGQTRDELVAGNRAGPNETEATIAEMLVIYAPPGAEAKETSDAD